MKRLYVVGAILALTFPLACCHPSEMDTNDKQETRLHSIDAQGMSDLWDEAPYSVENGYSIDPQDDAYSIGTLQATQRITASFPND